MSRERVTLVFMKKLNFVDTVEGEAYAVHGLSNITERSVHKKERVGTISKLSHLLFLSMRYLQLTRLDINNVSELLFAHECCPHCHLRVHLPSNSAAITSQG